MTQTQKQTSKQTNKQTTKTNNKQTYLIYDNISVLSHGLVNPVQRW